MPSLCIYGYLYACRELPPYSVDLFGLTRERERFYSRIKSKLFCRAVFDREQRPIYNKKELLFLLL